MFPANAAGVEVVGIRVSFDFGKFGVLKRLLDFKLVSPVVRLDSCTAAVVLLAVESNGLITLVVAEDRSTCT